MSAAPISSHIWPTVIGEATRYWLRRHRLVLGVLAALTAGFLLFTVGSQEALANTLLPFVMVFVPIGAGLLTMSGIVGDERASGIILVWFQKPGSIVRSYAIRYIIYQGILLAFAVGFAAALLAFGALGAPVEVKADRLPLIVTTFAVLPAAIVFALSAWGVRRDSTAAFLVIMVMLAFAASFPFNSQARELLLMISFPIDEIEVISKAASWNELLRPITIIVGQFVAWSSVGMFGLLYTQRNLHRVG